jgi:hypothetical protein
MGHAQGAPKAVAKRVSIHTLALSAAGYRPAWL